MKATDRELLDHILNNGIDVPLFKQLVMAQAEIMRRFDVYGGNRTTLDLWHHLTERYGEQPGFKLAKSTIHYPLIMTELDRLVAMKLIRTEDGDQYYWVPLELEEARNENSGS